MAEVKDFSSDVPSENLLEGVAIRLDGVVFKCLGQMNVLDMSELAAAAITPGLADAAEAAGIYQTLALAFGEEEFARLQAHRREHKTPSETIMGILQYVNEVVQANAERITQRPTRPSSSSPGGPEGKEDLPARSISLSKQTVTDVDPDRPVKTPKPRAPRNGVRSGSGTNRRTG